MRLLRFAALLSLCACSAAPLRNLPPQAEWAHGSPAYVLLTDSNDVDENKAIIKSDIESDLGAAGFRVEAAPQGPGDLKVSLNISGMSSTTNVVLEQDGLQLDRFTFDWISLNCISITDSAGSMRCLAREVVSRIVASSPVATALAKKRPAPVVVAAESGRRAIALSGKLAVLDLRNLTSELTRDNAQYFTDVVRQAALRSQPQLEVMTRENLLVLLQASGKKLEECEGECEVDTGRRIGADAIVSGEIQKLGTSYKMTLRLHDTHEGRLLASSIASGKSIDELDQSAAKAADELFH